MTAGSALPVLAWQHHLNTDLAGFEGKFGQWLTAGAQQAAGDYGAPVGRELYGQVTEAFLKAAFDPSGRALQIIFLSLILAAGAVLYARFRMKKKWRLGWILVSGIAVTVLYYAGMLYLYLFSMPAEEALRLAGFERYACSAAVLFAGSLIMGTTVDLEQSFAAVFCVRRGCRRSVCARRGGGSAADLYLFLLPAQRRSAAAGGVRQGIPFRHRLLASPRAAASAQGVAPLLK